MLDYQCNINCNLSTFLFLFCAFHFFFCCFNAFKILLSLFIPDETRVNALMHFFSKQKKRKRRRKKKRSPSPKQSEKMEKLVQRIVSPLSCSRNHSISPDMDKVKKSSSQTNLLPSAGCIQPPKLKMLSSNAVPGGSSSANKSNLHQTEVNNVETKLPTSKAKSQYWKAEVCVTQVMTFF